MKNTLSRISFIVHENQKFQVSDRLLCTISGGQDSILNVIILYHLESLYVFRLNLAYCNHFWQPTNFYTLFELFKFGYLLNKSINNIVPKQRILSEEEAHFWRQKNFYQLGTYFNLNHISLGHSLSDKIETAFWNFVRGSGPNGLISLKQNSFITNKNFQKLLAQHPLTLNLKSSNQGPGYLQPSLKTRLVRDHRYSSLKFNENQKYRKFLSEQTEQKKYFFQIKFKTQPLKNYSKNQFSNLGKIPGRNYLQVNKEFQQYIYLFNLAIKSRIQVKRPLLCFSRIMIGKLMNQNQLPRVIDSTNKSRKLIRNKFRLMIFPLLNSSLEIKFQSNINKYLNIVEVEQSYFSFLEKNLLKIYLKQPYEIKYLSLVQLAIKRFVIKTLLKHYMHNQVILNYIMHIINFKS